MPSIAIELPATSRMRSAMGRRNRTVISPLGVTAVVLIALGGGPRGAWAQGPVIRYGSKVPQDVQMIYDRGLQYLAKSQQDDGSWPGNYTSGITSLCLLAFLADGEDPNFGRFRLNTQRAVHSIVLSQDPKTGYIPNSMYCHGFGTLALAESYGVIDDARIWQDESTERPGRRTIGEALELAVRCSITAQKKNKAGGWRYSPQDNNADTSISGAVLVGLLAARNAGIEVPDQSIDQALAYYRNSTSDDGTVAYTGGIGGMGASMNRSSIATLVFAIGKHREWPEYTAALNHINTRLDHHETGYPFYFRYYMAQALFQGDFDNWVVWKRDNSRMLKAMQRPDGSFEGGQGGPAYSTAMALLSLAIDFRFLPIYER